LPLAVGAASDVQVLASYSPAFSSVKKNIAELVLPLSCCSGAPSPLLLVPHHELLVYGDGLRRSRRGDVVAK
jgi:hypothetical protein